MSSIYFFYMFTRIGTLCGFLAVVAFIALIALSTQNNEFHKRAFVCFVIFFIVHIVTPSKLAVTMEYLVPILEEKERVDNLPDYIVKYLKNQVSIDFNKRDY